MDAQKTLYSDSVAVQGVERIPDAAARVDAHHHQAQLWYVRCPMLSPGSVEGSVHGRVLCSEVEWCTTAQCTASTDSLWYVRCPSCVKASRNDSVPVRPNPAPITLIWVSLVGAVLPPATPSPNTESAVVRVSTVTHATSRHRGMYSDVIVRGSVIAMYGCGNALV
jgi:hypothetical protein